MRDYAEYASALGSLAGFLIFIIYAVCAEAWVRRRQKADNRRRTKHDKRQ